MIRGLLALGVALALAGCAETVAVEGAGCNERHPCPSGYFCKDAACVLVRNRCASDGDCVVGRCQPDLGICVQCLGSTDCGCGACLADGWVCGCAGAEDCCTGRCLREGGASGRCVACTSHAQCESGLCDIDTGRCVSPGESRNPDEVPADAERKG